MKIMDSIINRGMNPNTGVSPQINVSDIEYDTKKRIVGNGSTIRRDNKPYSFFNMENIKEKSRVIGFVFSGYKTRRELIGELRHQNESSQKRIKLEESKINERDTKIIKLSSTGRLDDLMFTYNDLKPYITL